MALDFVNSALLHDEILLEIVLVLEHGWPVGPKFAHSLGSLIEATVIHDKVYYDPLNYTNRTDLSGRDSTSLIIQSHFTKQLTQEGVLNLFPLREKVDQFLKENGRDYETINFLMDATWTGVSFADANPSDEEITYQAILDLMAIPSIFQQKYLRKDHPEAVAFFDDPSVLRIIDKFGFSPKDLELVEALNRRASAHLDLACNIGANLYPTLMALPHHIGAIRSINSKARELYDTIKAKVLAVDKTTVGSTSFERVPIPPLAQIVIDKCADSSAALPEQISDLRHRHRTFREYLTEYERTWLNAKTRKDRLELEKEFRNPWNTLTMSFEMPSSRFIYILWDILKEPHKILKTLGDKLAKKGHEIFVVSRVRGLHDFWKDLTSSPALGA